MAHREFEITENLLKRFWEKVEKTETCWIWKAFKNKQGYGRIGLSSGKCINAHRVSYVIHKGKIPEDQFICHTCDNPSCVNPDHLFAGTRQDNIDDMIIKKRSRHFNNHIFYGVVIEERKGNQKSRYRSFICKNEKMIYLSRHTSLMEAARNYDRIAYIVFGERVKLNFPEEYDLSHYK